VSKLRGENDILRNENRELSRKIGDHDEVINDLHKQLEENVSMTKTALSKANYNKQYT
jgi:ABC-type Fe3+-citrate transport system substrate-binding protein